MNHHPPRSARPGLSALEVLICVGCLLLILVIAIPWLLSVRGTSRDSLCLARSKKLSDAVIAYADDRNGNLPYLVDKQSWPAALAPYLDLPAAVAGKELVPEEKLKTLEVPQFVCPDDPRSGKTGALSYVANGGYGLFPVDAETKAVSETGTHTAAIDLDGDGEVSEREYAINYATGVIWRPDPRPAEEAFRMSLPFISNHDGSEYTLLLSENLNAGNWLSRQTMDLSFVIGRERLTFENGPDQRGPLHLKEANLGPFAVNGNLGSLPDQCPGPSSLHGDFVNAMYCDGRGGPLSAKIDPLAYARLMTSDGLEFGQSGDPTVFPQPKEK